MSLLEVEVPRECTDADATRPERNGAPPTREIRHEYTRSLPPLLSQLGVSLLVSTYQAGKVVAVGVAHGELTLSYHNFERAMGLAVKPDGIAVAARAQVWFLQAAPELAARVEPPGRHDACFLTRSSHFTGEIQAHELAWGSYPLAPRGRGVGGEGELWLVNTAFGCLCTLDGRHSFVPRWRPPFLTALAAEDRCHLNGLAVADGAPKYVTALAETDTPQGWRADKVHSGCLIDVASGQTVARGFAMPHSPRVHRGRVWMLHSGAGQLVLVDPSSGRAETVTELPGYTRGLALHDRFAFVGLSKIRETSTFGGMPIAERRPELKCGVGVVDLGTGRLMAHLEFVTGVEEIFDVQVVPGVRCLALSGPYASLDGAAPIWTVPQPPPTPGRS
ncbi:MAG TPA: TIGR03032 family protein [Gemmataceae bacterium]|nr:TIGR03032 family protein [Gemmataceae bacterium]